VKEITAERTKYVYFTSVDGVPQSTTVSYEAENQLKTIELRDYIDSLTTMEKYLGSSPDVRLVLIHSPFHPNTADVHYLYWNDGTDLDALDRRVEEDTFADTDFRNSIKTHFNRTWCSVCRYIWDTLVFDSVDPYAGAPGLLQEKMTGFDYLKCPNCGAPFRIWVVKVFGWTGHLISPITHHES
jgi:hypothetical protein